MSGEGARGPHNLRSLRLFYSIAKDTGGFFDVKNLFFAISILFVIIKKGWVKWRAYL